MNALLFEAKHVNEPSPILKQMEAGYECSQTGWLRGLCQRFWAWFLAPVPFPRDHWYRPERQPGPYNKGNDRPS